MPISTPPSPGNLVTVRERRFVVVEVQQSTLATDRFDARQNNAEWLLLLSVSSCL